MLSIKKLMTTDAIGSSSSLCPRLLLWFTRRRSGGWPIKYYSAQRLLSKFSLGGLLKK